MKKARKLTSLELVQTLSDLYDSLYLLSPLFPLRCDKRGRPVKTDKRIHCRTRLERLQKLIAISKSRGMNSGLRPLLPSSPSVVADGDAFRVDLLERLLLFTG
jgi:hypothetical protein